MEAEGGPLLERALPHGQLAAWRLPLAAGDAPAPFDPLSLLHPAEARLARRWGPRRVRSWVAGRLALRRALALAGLPVDGPILVAPGGAPQVPGHVAVSISHTVTAEGVLAVGLVGPAAEGALGVDVEPLHPARPRALRGILTTGEQAAVRALPEPERWAAALVRWCLKEAAFKAWAADCAPGFDPREVTACPLPTGEATLTATGGGAPAWGPLEARWEIRGDLVLATARRKVPTSPPR